MTNGETIAYFKGMLEAGGYTEPIDMAIEALKAGQAAYDKGFDDGLEQGLKIGEPCADCVSRKAAIDACLKGLNRKEMVANIKSLLSVTPAQKWIPVSEKLPEETGWYIVTIRTEKGIAVCEQSYRKGENHWTTLKGIEVIAWMPLPEPYKEVDDEASD